MYDKKVRFLRIFVGAPGSAIQMHLQTKLLIKCKAGFLFYVQQVGQSENLTKELVWLPSGRGAAGGHWASNLHAALARRLRGQSQSRDSDLDCTFRIDELSPQNTFAAMLLLKFEPN